jgi:PEP-CTERM motif-containing protein
MEKSRKSMMRKTLFGTIAALSLVLLPALAGADPLNDFQITPSALGSPAAPITADKAVGGYVETFSVTGPGTFTSDAYWVAGQYFANDGTLALFPVQDGLGIDYSIYAIFTATGTFSQDPITGVVDFTATSGSLTLYVDNDLNTGLTAPVNAATGDVTRTNFGDDQILATAPVLFGHGDADPAQLNSGDFEIIFQPFVLTALGSSYFTSPVPFYLTLNVTGQFNFFNPVGNQTLNGSADAFFSSPIPEPASMTLLGLGLLGAASARRRRKAGKA